MTYAQKMAQNYLKENLLNHKIVDLEVSMATQEIRMVLDNGKSFKVKFLSDLK